MASRIAAEKGPQTTAPSGSLLDCVGNTPLLKLSKIVRPYRPVEIYAKAEWFNPTAPGPFGWRHGREGDRDDVASSLE